MSEADYRALAERFFNAIEAGDADIVADSYTDDAVIWHNFTRAEQSKADNLETLKGMMGRLSDRSYHDRRVHIIEGGFVQQHVLSGMRKDGSRVSMPGILVCHVKGGKIARIEEYLDSADVAEFRKTFD
jgi:ketosteroid isomerase-like protein